MRNIDLCLSLTQRGTGLSVASSQYHGLPFGGSSCGGSSRRKTWVASYSLGPVGGCSMDSRDGMDDSLVQLSVHDTGHSVWVIRNPRRVGQSNDNLTDSPSRGGEGAVGQEAPHDDSSGPPCGRVSASWGWKGVCLVEVVLF
jgi:hypothetical protein